MNSLTSFLEQLELTAVNSKEEWSKMSNSTKYRKVSFMFELLCTFSTLQVAIVVKVIDTVSEHLAQSGKLELMEMAARKVSCCSHRVSESLLSGSLSAWRGQHYHSHR